jgi:hypothetical protein
MKREIFTRIPKRNLTVILDDGHGRDLSQYYPRIGDTIQMDNRYWDLGFREWKQKKGEEWTLKNEWLKILEVKREADNYYIVDCIKSSKPWELDRYCFSTTKTEVKKKERKRINANK